MADSQFGAPVIIAADGSAKTLTRIPLTSSRETESYNEDWLQRLVFENPHCLPLAEIDSAYSTLLPLCRELATPAGPVDALYITPDGRLVVLEAKLWRNPEARRKVVGQILDYAKELSRWTYEDLQREAIRAGKHSTKELYQLVRERYSHIDEAAFIDQVTSNRRHGRFMLLIVGDGIREGAGAIAEFLEDFATLDFSFGLVELALFRLDNDGILVQPRVLAKTATIRRSVISIQDGSISVRDDTSSREEAGELTDLQGFYQDFWMDLISKLRLDDKTQTPPNVTRKGNVFLSLPPSGSESWITVFFEQSSREVGLFLTFARGTFGDVANTRLLQDRQQIDKELGLPTTWASVDGKHTIMSKTTFPDLRSPKHREQIMAFLSDGINRFVNVFRPRLARIAEEL